LVSIQNTSWNKTLIEILLGLLLSPLIGCCLAYLGMKLFINFISPSRSVTQKSRTVLIGTSSIVSFAHGANDGQKGISLLMILFLLSSGSVSGHVPMSLVIITALALGFGTMIGWERVTTTLGTRVGKTHITSLHGGIAESIAATTILLASIFGFPVSTTHTLTSAIAGTMYGSGDGVNSAWIKRILLAWILTIPCVIAASLSLTFALLTILQMMYGT